MWDGISRELLQRATGAAGCIQKYLNELSNCKFLSKGY
jgi:hypothetical protein